MFKLIHPQSAIHSWAGKAQTTLGGVEQKLFMSEPCFLMKRVKITFGHLLKSSFLQKKCLGKALLKRHDPQFLLMSKAIILAYFWIKHEQEDRIKKWEQVRKIEWVWKNNSKSIEMQLMSKVYK